MLSKCKLSSFLLLSTLTICNPYLFSDDRSDSSSSMNGPQKVSEICSPAPRPDRITLRHIEANGVGYNTGYSTLEGFFAPACTQQTCWVPFLDLRAHLFNNGKPAANAGVGLRYVGQSRIWGINAYYDYRNTKRQKYNQVSSGLESLGKVWDFRINGYLPFGTKKTHLFQTDFNSFKGHEMILSSKYEFAMKGANAEVGAHITEIKYAKLYAAAGPYVFFNHGRHAWGGEVRAALNIGEYVRVEGNTSYDPVFKWIGQGQVSLILPFDGKKEIKPKSGRSCPDELILRERAFQRVDRNEIIVIDRKHKKSVAIDPATGEPYNFVFVNNTSSSNGTFESPYPTLLLAQTNSAPNDIIYVYQGDGTTKGMDSGIVMQQDQSLFGSGISHPLATTRGEIIIPQMSPGLPMISNSGITVMMAENNVIAGINIFSSLENAIYGDGINQATILNNVVMNGASAATPCIEFDGTGSNNGTIIIQNNTITAVADRGIDIFPIGNDHYVVDISGNNLNTQKNAISLEPSVNSIITSSIVNNQVISNVANSGQRSIFLNTKNNAEQDFTIEGNTITGSTGMLVQNANSASVSGTIQNNSFVNNTNGTALKITSTGSSASGSLYFVDIIDNYFSNNSPSNLDVNISSTQGKACILLNDNVSTRPLSQIAYSLGHYRLQRRPDQSFASNQ